MWEGFSVVFLCALARARRCRFVAVVASVARAFFVCFVESQLFCEKAGCPPCALSQDFGGTAAVAEDVVWWTKNQGPPVHTNHFHWMPEV